MSIKDVLKEYVIDNGGVAQGKSTSELLKEAIGEVIPAPEEEVDPESDPNPDSDTEPEE